MHPSARSQIFIASISLLFQLSVLLITMSGPALLVFLTHLLRISSYRAFFLMRDVNERREEITELNFILMAVFALHSVVYSSTLILTTKSYRF